MELRRRSPAPGVSASTRSHPIWRRPRRARVRVSSQGRLLRGPVSQGRVSLGRVSHGNDSFPAGSLDGQFASPSLDRAHHASRSGHSTRRKLAVLVVAVVATLVGGAVTTVAAQSPLSGAIEAHRADDLERAFELALAALARSGGSPEAWETHRLVVEIARDAGRLEEAEAALKSQRAGRNQAATEWAIGLVHLWRNEFAAAIPHFELSQSLSPRTLEPYLALADCHLALGDRTLAWLNQMRARMGHDWAEIFTRALVLDATGDPSRAAALYEEAARFAASEPEIPHRLAIAETRLGHHQAAEKSLDRASRLVREKELAGGWVPTRAARALAAIDLTRAEIAMTTGRFDEGLARLADARAHAVEAVDRATLARALILEGRLRTVGLDPAAARVPIRQGLQLARRIGDARSERAALEAMAELELNQFQTRSASEQLKAALARSAYSGDARGIERTLTLLGLTALARGEYLEALTYFHDATARAVESGDFVVQQRAIEGTSRAQLLLSDHWQALDLALDALRLADEFDFKSGICRSHLTAGQAAFQLGLYDRAQDHLERAAAVAERHGLARLEGRANLRLGQVAAALGDADMAMAWFRRALDLARRAHDPALEADGVSAIGEGFLDLGAYDQALRQYERALAMATEAGYLEGRLENLTRAGEALKRLGAARRSVALFREGLRLSQGLHNRVSQATNYSHLGEIYAGLGDFTRSLGYLNRGLKMNRETGSVLGEGECLLAICRAYNQAANHDAAIEHCNEALAFAESHGNEAERARVSIEIGNAYLGLGSPERAEPYFRASHQLAESLDYPDLRWPAAHGMARVLAAQGKDAPAIQMSREAVATLERLRSELALPEMRAGFLENKFEPYEHLVLLLVRQGLFPEAFRTMEYSRSRTFLELLTDFPVGDDSDGDRIADLQRRNLAMRREILRRTEDLAALPASADRDSATTAVLAILHELRRKQDELQEAIARELPGAAMTTAEPLSLEDVQAMLDPGSALLEYYVTRDQLVIFLVTRDGVRATARPVSEAHLAARARLLRSALSEEPSRRSGEPLWYAPAAALTKALFDPVRNDPLLAGRNHLHVVPHKFLHQVPFQALITGTEGERPRFLVEDYLISYAPSASILKHCLDRDAGRRQTLLALAHPAPQDVTGRELMYVTEEVKSLGQKFGAAAVVRIGPDATETSVKADAGGFDVVHIATHYTPEESDPLRSALSLAATDCDDGRLEVWEVIEELSVRGLVVLSGCATGAPGTIGARLPEGDDWVGLTRAFIHAGAPSVVATLWRVSDRATSRFMERFYDLLPTMPKSAALSLTQREMLAGLIPGAAEYTAPYYWAPFVLIGSAN